MRFYGYKIPLAKLTESGRLLAQIPPEQYESYIESLTNHVECFVVDNNVYIGFRVFQHCSVKELHFDLA